MLLIDSIAGILLRLIISGAGGAGGAGGSIATARDRAVQLVGDASFGILDPIEKGDTAGRGSLRYQR